jgi:Vacuolar protein sorting-associated protein 62
LFEVPIPDLATLPRSPAQYVLAPGKTFVPARLVLSTFSGRRNMAGFQSALSVTDAKQLLQTFAPYVWIYSSEPYFPCSVDWYLQRVQLGFAHEATIGYNTTLLSPTVSAANLNTTSNDGQSSGGALAGTVPGDNFFVLPVTGGAGSGTYTGWRPQSSGANAYRTGSVPPVYGGVIDRRNTAGAVIGYDLVYGFFFAYNGPAMNDPGFIGIHEGDMEHVVARVDSDKKILLAVYYRQHSGSDPYNGWYYPPGPDTPEAGGILFEAYSAQRCVVYCAQDSHASYPREADTWSYKLRGTDLVDQGYGWDTAQNVVVLNDPSQNYWLDYSGRFGAAPSAQKVVSFPPPSPIVQGWQNLITTGPFIDREIYCQELKGQHSRVSAGNTNIAQVPLSWTFDDPNGWLSTDQLNRITVNLSHDVSGSDQSAITGITNGCTKNPPYAHTDNVYISDLAYTDGSGKVHTGYSDAWQAMTAESIARGGSPVTFRIVCTWLGTAAAAQPQTALAMTPLHQAANP